MSDQHMEGLLANLRQQQDKTNNLSNVLAQFNEAFNHLLDQLSIATNLENLEQSGQKISELSQRIQGIETQLKESREAEMERLNKLDDRLSVIERIFNQEYEEQLEEARQEGIKEEKYAIARKMLEQEYEIELVAELTELNSEDMEMLIDSVRRLKLK